MSTRHKKKYIHEGWINKWTNFIGNWRPRYFMLEPGCLKYSLEKNGLVKESFILSHCTIRLIPDDPVRFDIDIVGRGSLCLRTDAPSEKHKWYISFKRAQKHLFQSYQRKVLTSSGVYSIEGTPGLSYKSQQDDLGQEHTPVKHQDAAAVAAEEQEASEQQHHVNQVPITGLFIKSQVGHESKGALACLLENCSCFREISTKILNEILPELTHQKSKVNTLETLIKEYCDATQELYVEELRSRQDLEQSLFKMTRRNMKLEQRVGETVVDDPEQELGDPLLSGGAASVGIGGVSAAKVAAAGAVVAPDDSVHMHVSSKLIDMDANDSDSSYDRFQGREDEYLDYCGKAKAKTESDTNADTDADADADADANADANAEADECCASANVATKNEVTARSEPDGEGSTVASDGKSVKFQRRTKLPQPRTEMNVSIWSILKDLIGKDLSRVSMPVFLNEPTTTLQRTSEDFQYANLLNAACQMQTSLERMAYVTIFSITPYESAVGRTFKPFNPLLGETFELVHRGYEFLAEQVGHHPPISAFHCCNEYFESFGSIHVTVKLTGKCVEASARGPFIVILKLPTGPERYSLQRSYVVVHNIIFGKMWIETVGTTIQKNITSGEFAVVQYLRKGWFDKEIHKMRGLVFDKFGVAHYYIYGRWSDTVYMQRVKPGKGAEKPLLNEEGVLDYQPNLYKNEDEAWDAFVNEINWTQLDLVPNSEVEVWKPQARPPNAENYYGFGYMTMELGDVTPEYDPKHGAQVARTDSRFRPDRVAYEAGKMDVAAKEKHRLEEKQRRAARERKDGEASYKPMWFDKSIDEETGLPTWTFNHRYWEAKENGTINDHTPDIFGT